MPSYLSQGEAGPPSEKELVSTAVQQAIAPTGTVYFMLLITLIRYHTSTTESINDLVL